MPPPPGNKALSFGLIKGNQGLIVPKHKAGYLLGGYLRFPWYKVIIPQSYKLGFCFSGITALGINGVESWLCKLQPENQRLLGCPRKLGSMVSKWVITPRNTPFISRWNNPLIRSPLIRSRDPGHPSVWGPHHWNPPRGILCLFDFAETAHMPVALRRFLASFFCRRKRWETLKQGYFHTVKITEM